MGDEPAHEQEPTGRAAATRRAVRGAAVVLFVVVTAGLVVGRAVGEVPFRWLEIVGAVTGAGCVLLVVRRSVWNFPVGIVSCVAYLVYFRQERLYGDAGLQVVFIVLGVHGWVAWVRGRTDPRPVRRVPLGEAIALACIFPVAWLGTMVLLEHVGGAAPAFDAFVTALSLVAQWLLNRRYVENWLAWIVVNQVAVYLFWSRGMHLTAGLYAIFLCMCVAGLVAWRQELDGKGQCWVEEPEDW